MDHNPSDPVDEAVRLLKTIGLDITYTDEGLRVIARQIIRAARQPLLDAVLELHPANTVGDIGTVCSSCREVNAARNLIWHADPNHRCATLRALNPFRESTDD